MALSQRSYSYFCIPHHLLKKEISVDASNSQKETIVTSLYQGKKNTELDLIDIYLIAESIYACTLFGCQEIVAINQIGRNI